MIASVTGKVAAVGPRRRHRRDRRGRAGALVHPFDPGDPAGGGVGRAVDGARRARDGADPLRLSRRRRARGLRGTADGRRCRPAARAGCAGRSSPGRCAPRGRHRGSQCPLQGVGYRQEGCRPHRAGSEGQARGTRRQWRERHGDQPPDLASARVGGPAARRPGRPRLHRTRGRRGLAGGRRSAPPTSTTRCPSCCARHSRRCGRHDQPGDHGGTHAGGDRVRGGAAPEELRTNSSASPRCASSSRSSWKAPLPAAARRTMCCFPVRPVWARPRWR